MINQPDIWEMWLNSLSAHDGILSAGLQWEFCILWKMPSRP